MSPPLNWTTDHSQPEPGSDAALALGWTWPAARQACDAHKRGDFTMSWQLWLDVDSRPAIRAAKRQRLASPCGLPWEVVGPTRGAGRIESEAARWAWAQHGRRLLRPTLSDLIGMGVSFWQAPSAVNPVTRRREIVAIERWPLNQVRFTATPFPDIWEPGKWICGYYAVQYGLGESVGATMYGPQDPSVGRAPVRAPDGSSAPGRAGVWVRFIQLPRPGETDGHWLAFGEGDTPHMDGAIVALDVPYVGGSILTRAWLNLAKTLGRQSPVGIMGPNTATGAEGTSVWDTPEGKAFRQVLRGIGVDADAALLPHGAQIGSFEITAQTAGLFPEFEALNLEAVELAILNRSGTMAKEDSQYVNKGSPIERVPEKLVRDDVGCIERTVSHLLNLLAEENAGKLSCPVQLVGHFPDTEQDARKLARQAIDKGEIEKLAAFWGAVFNERSHCEIPPTPDGQARLDAIAAACGVTAPRIPPAGFVPILVKAPKPTTGASGDAAAGIVPEAAAGATPDAMGAALKALDVALGVRT